jgi:hypothetical protein
MVLRSVEQVLLEEWGTVDHAKIAAIIDQRSETPYSQTGEWTTLKLPYQAPSCPPLPSWKQILHAHARHPLNMRNGLHDVCRISNTVVKFSGNPNVVEVCRFYNPQSVDLIKINRKPRIYSFLRKSGLLCSYLRSSRSGKF